MSAVDDLFARARDERGIKRLSYFHCDHFEPWRFDGRGNPMVGDSNADAVEAFVATTAALHYAHRLTLFTKSPIRTITKPKPRSKAVPGDEISFNPLNRRERLAHGRALSAIVASGHELQVHIHHERFTHNDWYSTSPERPENEVFRDFLTHRTTPEADEARLKLYIKMTLAEFRRATGLPFARWHFVHGMWSLNGSDRDFCTVDGEIRLLQKLGCIGDFTFPAPRTHCNPASERPYLVKPVRAPKGYDVAEAKRYPADGRLAKKRFFIWSTSVSPRFCSLDTVSKSFASLSEDPARWAAGLVDGAVERRGSLYVKTHAHSMMGAYLDGPEVVYPHTHPAVRRLFDLLLNAAARRGIAFDPITASEAYLRFVEPDPLPPPPEPANEAEPAPEPPLSLPADASAA